MHLGENYNTPVRFMRLNLTQRRAAALIENYHRETPSLTEEGNHASKSIVGCVDTRTARLAIFDSASNGSLAYWLDCGNMRDADQVILGEIGHISQEVDHRLPRIANLFPEMTNPAFDEKDKIPSCSLAEALKNNHSSSIQSYQTWPAIFYSRYLDLGKYETMVVS